MPATSGINIRNPSTCAGGIPRDGVRGNTLMHVCAMMLSQLARPSYIRKKMRVAVMVADGLATNAILRLSKRIFVM